MTHIPPVVLHGDDGPTLLHFYFAAMPPPPGPLEEADIEDEDDYYGESGLTPTLPLALTLTFTLL